MAEVSLTPDDGANRRTTVAILRQVQLGGLVKLMQTLLSYLPSWMMVQHGLPIFMVVGAVIGVIEVIFYAFREERIIGWPMLTRGWLLPITLLASATYGAVLGMFVGIILLSLWFA